MSEIDLEQQRKRAKELLVAHRAGDVEAVARVHANLPRAQGMVPDEVRALPLVLADAQLVVAREAGFPTWPRMKKEVERAGMTDPVKPLERAVRARDERAVKAALATKEPARWEAREALEVAVENDDREIAALLLAYGCWPDFAGRRWGRWGGCLHAALLLDRPIELIRVLLDGGASVDARDRDGRTPREIATRVGRVDAERLLRAYGAEIVIDHLDAVLGAYVLGTEPPGAVMVRTTAEYRRSDHQHVCWAVRTGHHDILPRLLGLGLDPSVPDDDGDTALHLAVSAKAPAVVDELIAAGAPVDALDYRDETALTRAYREPDRRTREQLVERLLAAGATRQKPADLFELFEQAADAVVDGDLATLTALLDRERRLATMHSPRPHRATLLHYVAANGVEGWRQKSPPNAAAIARLLLARGAEPDALAATYGGGPAQTPLLLAVTSSHPDDAGVMAEIVNALVEGGARVDGVEDDHEPIHQARASGLAALVAAGARVDLPIAAALGMRDRVAAFLLPDGSLADGAELNARPIRDIRGDAQALRDREILGAALGEASFAGHTEIVADLLAAGALVGTKDAQGMTALHLAAWRVHLDTVRLLLARGAPLEAKNAYGGTVLDFVVWVIKNQRRAGADYATLVSILIEAGADLAAVYGLPTGLADVDDVFRRAGKLG
jgi:ankyrin repeat protein